MLVLVTADLDMVGTIRVESLMACDFELVLEKLIRQAEKTN